MVAEEMPAVSSTKLCWALVSFAILCLVCAPRLSQTIAQGERVAPESRESALPRGEENVMNVHYLEIVTPKAEETCDLLERTHGVTFGEPVMEFGNARVATLNDGRRLGVRAPMRDTEEPVVRPYLLVDDIEAAVEAARAAGAEIAIASMEIPGHGRFAIYILGGIQHGLWQL